MMSRCNSDFRNFCESPVEGRIVGGFVQVEREVGNRADIRIFNNPLESGLLVMVLYFICINHA